MSPLNKLVINFFKLLSDPIRLNIILKLKAKEGTAKEIQEELDISQSYTSQQLKSLLEANLIKVYKDDENIKIYSINNDDLFNILNKIQSFVIELEKEKYQKLLDHDKFGILS